MFGWPLSPQDTIELSDPTSKIPGGRPVPDPRDERARWPVLQATHAIGPAEVDALNAKQVSASVETVFSRDKLTASWIEARRAAPFHLISVDWPVHAASGLWPTGRR